MSLNYSWTDYFFIILVLFMAVNLAMSLRHPANLRAVERLLMKPFAVSAGIILLVFFTIGLLDCIHISSAKLDNRNTALDAILAPLGSTYERTFSSPLALNSYVSEIKMKNTGIETVRGKLTYPKNYLHTLKERNNFVVMQFYRAVAAASIVGMFLFGLAAILKRMVMDEVYIKFKTSIYAVWFTGVIVVLLTVFLYDTSRELHVLGTGKIGQDIFYYTLKSVRTGLVIGILTTLFTLPFALFLGVAAGYFGGLIDDIIQYLYTTLSSIPGVLLITASVLSMQTFIANHPSFFATLVQQADARLLALCIILGVTSWTSLCRLLRAEALKLKHIDYVTAARCLGVSSFKILRQHLLPNVMHIVLITLALDFSYLILAEAVLTYVGVGVAPMTISWGNMINSARLELARDPIVWWPMIAAFMFMFTLVLASNVFADAVEEAWNPRSDL